MIIHEISTEKWDLLKKEEPSINFRTENYIIWNFKFPKLNNRMEMRKEIVKLQIDKGKLSILKKKERKQLKIKYTEL